MSSTSVPIPLATAEAALAQAEQVLEAAEKSESAAPSLTAAQALDAWMAGYVRGTALSQDTAVYNRIFAAVREIHAAIAAKQEN